MATYNIPERLVIMTLWDVKSNLLTEAKAIFKDYFNGFPYIAIDSQKSQYNIILHDWCAFAPSKYLDKPLSKFVEFTEDIHIKAFEASLVSKDGDYYIYNYANLYGVIITISVKKEDLEKCYLEDT